MCKWSCLCFNHPLSPRELVLISCPTRIVVSNCTAIFLLMTSKRSRHSPTPYRLRTPLVLGTSLQVAPMPYLISIARHRFLSAPVPEMLGLRVHQRRLLQPHSHVIPLTPLPSYPNDPNSLHSASTAGGYTKLSLSST